MKDLFIKLFDIHIFEQRGGRGESEEGRQVIKTIMAVQFSVS